MPPALRKSLGAWQFLFGLVGLVLVALTNPLTLPDLGAADVGYAWFTSVAGLIFYAIVFASGVALWRGRRSGVFLALLAQIPQIVSFSVLGSVRFFAAAGPLISLQLGSDEQGFRVSLGSSFFLAPASGGASWEVNVNLLAIVLTVVLIRTLFVERSATK